MLFEMVHTSFKQSFSEWNLTFVIIVGLEMIEEDYSCMSKEIRNAFTFLHFDKYCILDQLVGELSKEIRKAFIFLHCDKYF